jgi:hypothetical protein
MSLTLCSIHPIQNSGRTIYMTTDFLKSLRINPQKVVLLKLGSLSMKVPVRLVKKTGSHLYLPKSVIQHLHLPRMGSILAKSKSSHEIHLGPLIGVLTNTIRNHQKPFGSITGFIRQVLQTGSNKSFSFAFSPRDVNWDQQTVSATFARSNGGWVRKKIPFPDVIYNRLSSRSVEKSTRMEQFKQRFQKRHIPMFNWSFFDKWDVYNLLTKDDAFKYVPESRINPSPEQIRNLLTKHKFIYLKPTAGSLGIGIYRITINPKHGYFVRYRKNGKNILLRFKKFSALMNRLGTNRGKLHHYVAQQGIRLIEIEGCPIDFRFHMNKNVHNQWVVSAIGAKKAGKGSVTTHLRTGGQLMTAEQALRQVYGNRAEQVLQNAKETAIKLAKAIEKNHNHILGELGFDIGIDNHDKMWMFEANAKPGRSIFKHPSLKEQEKSSLKHIYEHCTYLSHFRARRDA